MYSEYYSTGNRQHSYWSTRSTGGLLKTRTPYERRTNQGSYMMCSYVIRVRNIRVYNCTVLEY